MDLFFNKTNVKFIKMISYVKIMINPTLQEDIGFIKMEIKLFNEDFSNFKSYFIDITVLPDSINSDVTKTFDLEFLSKV